jgi:predicted  nucleic acid-binding Zn-ribbon protein
LADEPDNLVLQCLRRLDQKLDRVTDDVGELKIRMTSMEERLAGVEMSVAGVQRRIDRVEQRLDRIERRLELVDLPPDGVRE